MSILGHFMHETLPCYEKRFYREIFFTLSFHTIYRDTFLQTMLHSCHLHVFCRLPFILTSSLAAQRSQTKIKPHSLVTRKDDNSTPIISFSPDSAAECSLLLDKLFSGVNLRNSDIRDFQNRCITYIDNDEVEERISILRCEDRIVSQLAQQ